ncbi:MAG: hypothetical protein HY820_26600 [Acidobacteria bacterium]|nr:hypothetical protein [Acidobacteriota bacterium]
MSSKILSRENPVDAASFLWRHAGSGEIVRGSNAEGAFVASGLDSPGAKANQPSAANPQSQLAPAMHLSSSGPTWDQYREIEMRLRELEQQIPQREQQIRQATQREADAAATARWETAVEKLSRTVADIVTFRARLRREAEQDVVKLSLAVARRVLHREVSVDRDALLGLIRTAFEKLEAREIHRVRLRPEDVPLVTAFLERLGTPNRVEVQPDSSLERGGAVVETHRGNLDISLDTQLAEIERGFTDLLEKRTSS